MLGLKLASSRDLSCKHVVNSRSPPIKVKDQLVLKAYWFVGIGKFLQLVNYLLVLGLVEHALDLVV